MSPEQETPPPRRLRNVAIGNPSIRRVPADHRPAAFNACFHIALLHEGEAAEDAIDLTLATRVLLSESDADRLSSLERRARHQLRSDLLAIAAALR